MLRTVVRSLFNISTVLIVLALSGGLALAQLSAPLVGLIEDNDGLQGAQIRPILGMPGASSVQSPLRLAGATRAYLAPGGGWALVRRERSALGLVTFTGSRPGETLTLQGIAGKVDVVSFSPTGKSAALLSRSSGTIQVLTGLDGTPQIAAAIDSPGLSPQSVAVSDDGNSLVVLTQDGSLFFLSGQAPPRSIAIAGLLSGISFLPNQSSAVLADRASGTLSLISSANGVPGLRTVAGSLELAGEGVLVQPSRDGASVFIVALGGVSAYRVELASGATLTTALPIPATRLDRLRNGEAFVVSAELGQAAWFLVSSDSGLGTVFAPAIRGVEGPIISAR